MKLYKIGVCGYGVVGKGIHDLLTTGVVSIYDPHVKELIKYGVKVGREKEDFKDLDLIVISVPTEPLPNGKCDTSLVWASLEWIQEYVNKDTVILVKSTIPPNEAQHMFLDYDIVFSPEYMGESKYYTPPWKYPDPTDMKTHTWQIFGGNNQKTSRCVDIFQRRMGVDCQFWQTDVKTASLVKYMENNFFALKVTFCNEWFDLAKAYGVDYNELRELWLLDPRINKNHTRVFSKDRGYGGKCFPKDVKAIIHESKRVGVKPELTEAVNSTNERIRHSKKA